MGKGRTIASSVTLVLLIGLTSACGGSSKSYTAAQNELTRKERAAEAAEAKAAARKQAAALRKQAAERRKAAMAARLRENRRRALAASTSTTTTPAPTSSTTPTPTSVAPPPPTTPATTPPTDPPASGQDDLVSIQDALEDLNAAFRASVAAGITQSESMNYWVATGVYTGRQCAAFEARQGGGVIRESLSVRPGSVQADPGWIDPVVGSKPSGRVYRLVANNVQTLVTTGEKRTVSVPLHVTVRPDGQVLLFLRCK